MSETPARLWEGKTMIGPYGPLNAEQVAAASDREQPLLLEASAGAGKTLVLVERFVRDVLEGDGSGERLECDQILTITFTRKAAAELRGRIRNRLAALAASDIDEAQRARAAVAGLDEAWISTIDAFCARALRRHALLAGVDPAFTVIDEIDIGAFRRRAFSAAVAKLLDGPHQEQLLDLLAAESFDDLAREIAEIHELLRSAGQAEPRLPDPAPGEDPDGWIALLGLLLAEYGVCFAQEKRSHGGCDFSDVVFATVALLTDHPAIADEYRERFRRVLVDEFQDTNGLQLRLLDALGVESRFQVGDPLQSIYGFRHADLELFREVAAEHDEKGRRLQLVRNYRSRPPILDVINAGFSEAHALSGIDWVDIASGHENPDEEPWPQSPVGDPFVELLITDSAPWRDSDLDVATAEQRLVANRVRELLDAKEAQSGEIVILLETRTAMAAYVEELRRLDIAAVADRDDNWWSRPELVDLLVHARLIANRGDEEPLLGALRSPLCGVRLDTIALLGAENKRGPAGSLFEAFENACAESPEAGTPAAAIDDEERARLRGYREKFTEWATSSSAAGAGALLERIARDSGYEALLLQDRGGDLKLANVRKLIAFAHSWDGREGGDIRAFLDWADGAAIGSKETDAPAGGAIDIDGKDDPAGPVRLMTIHAAKGLEFPVVIVPRLGSGVQDDRATIRVEGEQVACSLYVAGDGAKRGAIGPFEELKAQAALRAHNERRRKIHVAVTRAERRLILSGAAKASGPWEVDNTSNREGCIRWIVPGLLGPDAQGLIEEGDDSEVPVGGVEGAPPLRLVVSTPERAGELLGAPEVVAQPEPGQVEAILQAAPETDVLREVPPTVSYSQLSRYSRCGYRWYLERVVGLPVRGEDGKGEGSGVARARGTLTHRLLELFTFNEPEAIPDADEIAAVAATVEDAPAGRDDLSEQATMLKRFAASDLWAQIAGASEVERESSFSIGLVPGDSTLPVLTGALDLLAQTSEDRALVVDYKTDRLGRKADLDEIVEERYSLQRDAYALVALRRGAAEVEVSYCFLERPDEVVTTLFTASHEKRLVDRLAAAARELADGEFPVSPDPGAGLCLGCPGRPLERAPGLCSHSLEATGGAG